MENNIYTNDNVEPTTYNDETKEVTSTMINTENNENHTSGYIDTDNNSEVSESVLIPEGIEEFINEDNVDAFKLLSLKSKVNDINSMVNQINEQPAKLITDSDDVDFIDSNLETVTEDEIKNMTNKEIDALLTNENGTLVEFTVNFDNNKNALYKFKRDFLIMRKQSLETIKTFDEELVKINAEIAESQEEFDKLIADFGNVTNLIRSNLVSKLENADTDEKKQLFEKMLVSFDNGMDLDNIKAYCKSYKGQSIICDHKDDKKSHYIYRRYLKVIETLDIKSDLTSFSMLENKFLPVEYQERPNIFVFAVIHYISSLHNKNYTKTDGLFLTQFMINLKNLYFDKFDTAEEKERFITNIEDVIKIIG